MMRKASFVTLICLLPGVAFSEDKAFTLSAPAAMIESGFLKHIVPRFSLKTGVKIDIVADDAQAGLGSEGVAVFRDDARIWHLSGDDPDIARFRDWLLSEIGKRAVAGFDDGIYSGDLGGKTVVAAPSYDGDIAAGEQASLTHCGRCHVINESNRMDGLGSTPSFALMRTFPDWNERFSLFYVLKPHAAFTQITDVTQPFDQSRPSPIVPIELSLDDLEAIIAYVSVIAPADLGAPIQSQPLQSQ